MFAVDCNPYCAGAIFDNHPHLKESSSYKISSSFVTSSSCEFHKNNASPYLVRRYRTFCKSCQLLSKQREVSVYKPVVHIGHGKEIGIENG